MTDQLPVPTRKSSVVVKREPMVVPLLIADAGEQAQSPHRSKNGQLGEHNVPKGRLIVSQRWQYD
jgi:hypothetical protein